MPHPRTTPLGKIQKKQIPRAETMAAFRGTAIHGWWQHLHSFGTLKLGFNGPWFTGSHLFLELQNSKGANMKTEANYLMETHGNPHWSFSFHSLVLMMCSQWTRGRWGFRGPGFEKSVSGSVAGFGMPLGPVVWKNDPIRVVVKKIITP